LSFILLVYRYKGKLRKFTGKILFKFKPILFTDPGQMNGLWFFVRLKIFMQAKYYCPQNAAYSEKNNNFKAD